MLKGSGEIGCMVIAEPVCLPGAFALDSFSQIKLLYELTSPLSAGVLLENLLDEPGVRQSVRGFWYRGFQQGHKDII